MTQIQLLQAEGVWINIDFDRPHGYRFRRSDTDQITDWYSSQAYLHAASEKHELVWRDA